MKNETIQIAAQTITFPLADADKARDWIVNRGGIAVWSNKDLGSSSVGSQTFTPALTDGRPTTAPHWKFGTSGPDFIVTHAAQVELQSYKVVSRVKVRQGPPYLGGIHRLDRAKLDNALRDAGANASWTPDYSNRSEGSAWFEAVISVPDVVQILTLS